MLPAAPGSQFWELKHIARYLDACQGTQLWPVMPCQQKVVWNFGLVGYTRLFHFVLIMCIAQDSGLCVATCVHQEG